MIKAFHPGPNFSIKLDIVLCIFTGIWRIAFHEIVTRNESKLLCVPVLVKYKFINNHYSFPYGIVNE